MASVLSSLRLAQEAAREYGVPHIMTLEEIAADPQIELVD